MRAASVFFAPRRFGSSLSMSLLFAVSVSALLFFTYWNTRRTLDAQTDQIIEAEITGLSEQYQRLGLRGLAESVISRSLHRRPGGLYLLTDEPASHSGGQSRQLARHHRHARQFRRIRLSAPRQWRAGNPARARPHSSR